MSLQMKIEKEDSSTKYYYKYIVQSYIFCTWGCFEVKIFKPKSYSLSENGKNFVFGHVDGESLALPSSQLIFILLWTQLTTISWNIKFFLFIFQYIMAYLYQLHSNGNLWWFRFCSWYAVYAKVCKVSHLSTPIQ